MNALKTIIADDVPRFVDHLTQKLAEHCPNIQLMGSATNLQASYELIIQHKPDLVILDIEFGGPTSFELLKRLKDENLLNFQVIFLTGYTETSHFINAFRYSALQYLLKPIDHEMLIEAVDKAFEIVRSKAENQMPEQVDVMIQNIKSKEINKPDLILLKQIKKVYEKVRVEDILYFESDATMTDVFLTDGRKIKTVELIGSYDYLTKSANFFRISQSNIVNLSQISLYEAADNNVCLSNGTKLHVSRQRDKELRRWFQMG